jgi:phosphatidylserine/phosphatidylglycerophosphate/cardiolipin synthase-like enzyme
MPGFGPLFDPLLVSTLEERVVRLDDPPRLDPLPIVRPGVAQHAGSVLVVLDLQGPAAIPLSSPIDGLVRRVALAAATPLPGGATEVLEVVAQPFSVRAPLGGLPTFYLAPFDAAPPDGERVARGDVIAQTSTRVWIAARLQDAFSAAPYDWIPAIGAAATTSDQPGWLAQEPVYGGRERLRVTDHVGAPVPGHVFAITLRRDSDGGIEDQWERTLDARSDLALTVSDQPLVGSTGTFSSLYAPPGGRRFALRWIGVPGPQAITTGVQSFYPAGPSAPPDEPLVIGAGAPLRRTLQTLAIEHWFAPPREGSGVPMFRTGSRVEPLVDGQESFRRLALDLDEARSVTVGGTPLGAHFTGLFMMDFPLVAGRDDTKLSAYADAIVENGGSLLVLACKIINLRDPNVSTVRMAAILLLYALTDVGLFIIALESLPTDERAAVFLFFAVTGAAFALTAIQLSETAFEKSQPALDTLNEGRAMRIAIYSRPPMTFDDNPLTPPSQLYSLEQDFNQPGFWHTKAQLVKRSVTAGPESHVAYVGGIDVNPNRMDTPSHQISGPFHDVHARLSGPIVIDAFESFRERWEHDAPLNEAPAASVVVVPGPADFTPSPSGHIARIGRTYYAARPGTQSPLTFAPDGERTIYETLIRAIASARDHIYIEDQYFTPNDEFIDALVTAAASCRRLLIMIPTGSDQIFGDRRRQMIIDRLRGDSSAPGWGNRFFIGCPMRRTRLTAAGPITGTGRCTLATPASATDDGLDIVPASRVPKPPGWLWVDGELMLARSADNTTVGGTPAKHVKVIRERSGSLELGTNARAHDVGAAVTFSQPKGIYVHAKCMMIDDIFVSIGSANLNRRGFFHDGELNVFAIPEALRSAADNPARALRTALWAEQLGLPLIMGSVLSDATSAFDLFLRSRFITRAIPYSAIDIRPEVGVTDIDLVPGSLLQILKLHAGLVGPPVVEQMLDEIWNMAIDPTSFVDPNPQPGPV